MSEVPNMLGTKGADNGTRQVADICYEHSDAVHSLAGPRAALPLIFPQGIPKSILDVGCGTGTWLKSASELGSDEVLGIDGVLMDEARLHIPRSCFRRVDLTKHWDVGQRFGLVICLEVAEHLDACHAEPLVEALCRHSELVLFSAACPGQGGQNHVNCQWPEYWQRFFNKNEFACSDECRWRIWEDARIEPWYRQNIFTALRDPHAAGREPRLRSVIHPDMVIYLREAAFEEKVREIEKGRMKIEWYFGATVLAIGWKVRRHILKR
jgi:SAM-dependent methyltransferase